MSSLPKNSSKISPKITPRKSSIGRRTTRRTRSRKPISRRRCSHGSNINDVDKVSGKLEALKNLIPAAAQANINGGGDHVGKEVKADQLFQETADYIVLLRSQVFVLQRLIEFYGSSGNNVADDNSNNINLVS